MRPADPVQDRAAVLALWRQAFSQPQQHPIKFDWCYAGPPPGNGRLYLLECKDPAHIIGVQGIVAHRWWLQGRTVNAGICADLVVDQQHRSIGPALTLVAGAVESEIQAQDLRLLYAFPNRRTEVLYRRRAYPRLNEITRYARPLHSRIWLRRRGMPVVLAGLVGAFIDLAAWMRQLPRGLRDSRFGSLVPASCFDTRFDALWARVCPTAGPMAIRNAALLQWRFGNHFVGQTQIMMLVSGQGQIDGYIVYTVGEDLLVTVLDFLAVENEQVLPVMFRMFVRAMQRRGCHGISLEFCGPSAVQSSLRRLGFSSRETHPVYLLVGQEALSTSEFGRVYLTAYDRDQ